MFLMFVKNVMIMKLSFMNKKLRQKRTQNRIMSSQVCTSLKYLRGEKENEQ